MWLRSPYQAVTSSGVVLQDWVPLNIITALCECLRIQDLGTEFRRVMLEMTKGIALN